MIVKTIFISDTINKQNHNISNFKFNHNFWNKLNSKIVNAKNTNLIFLFIKFQIKSYKMHVILIGIQLFQELYQQKSNFMLLYLRRKATLVQ